jgi:formimidoylglutamate deiminase
VITDVWSAGRHMVHKGQHRHRESITRNYRTTMAALRTKL